MAPRIPMTGLTDQYAALKGEVDEAVLRVMASGRYIMGPEVEEFERDMAAYCGVKHAIGVASGTDALVLSLKACGIGPGDEVITSPFTFIATAAAITHCDAQPVFADIDPRTYNIDASLIESRITPNTRAIIPVHLFGQPAEMEAIMSVARTYGLAVIEDCAQALGAEYRGKKVGSFGDAGCLSFFPSKNLGAFGDAGMVVTNSSELAGTLRILRQHGAKTTYFHLMPGFNSRLDAVQAAVLRVKLKYLDRWSEQRRRMAALYSRLFEGNPDIATPRLAESARSSANYYTVRLNTPSVDRAELRRHLADDGIETLVYYPLSLHLQEMYRHLGYQQGDFPHSELAQEQVLSLPLYPELRSEQVHEIAGSLSAYLSKSKVAA